MASLRAAVAAEPVSLLRAPIKLPSLHDQLVERGARWLRQKGCKLVLSEFSAAQEIPDVIGWRDTYGTSYLIECKTSRGDFLRDLKKPWRREPDQGVGTYRYFLCPPRMIKPAELPLGWGLLYAHNKIITIEAGEDPARYVRDPVYSFHRNHLNETRMLLSALNRLRLHHGGPEFDRLVHATYESKRGETL